MMENKKFDVKGILDTVKNKTGELVGTVKGKLSRDNKNELQPLGKKKIKDSPIFHTINVIVLVIVSLV